MTNFIPIFPLEIVVYPNEVLNLHIFEPKYIQLINECINEAKPFGIPIVVDNKLKEYGVLLEIERLEKRYNNGEMDIKTKCLKIFRTIELVKEIPDKLFSGAIVSYPDNDLTEGDSKLSKLIIDEVERLYGLLDVEEKLPIQKGIVLSYSIAHFLGFSKAQEYELLTLFVEMQRLEYIRRHLKKISPLLKELEKMKARIKMNGHFQDLSLSDFDL